ncbi:hypothetical protein GCM10009809_39970 [Isoptericola hypogeus]|uniref:Uncharacterized protein n=1 Tax=Isoptericola hypogeus TaxID=300179 RepID=A0ABP4VWY6_9MICO
MNRTASLDAARTIRRRYSDDPQSYYDGLRQFGIRDANIWNWVSELFSDPERFDGWDDTARSKLVRQGWCPTESWEFLTRWEPPEHYWIPPFGAYVAFGYYDEADAFNGRTLTDAVPGWRISAKVTRSRFVVQGIVDSYDGDRIEEIGSVPLPCCATTTIRRPVCGTCYLELPLHDVHVITAMASCETRPMARTERRSWGSADQTGGNLHLDPDGRDRKSQCWCCSGWKRPARRRDRHEAVATLRRGQEFSRSRDSFWVA